MSYYNRCGNDVETRDRPNFDRYQRQARLPQFGAAAQQKLAGASVLIIGCGALGSAAAEQLARAGVGTLRLADRDIVELSNLQRQTLFDESDAEDALPKAVAAAKRLSRINSSIAIDPLVIDVHAGNIESLARCDLILDGTDNVETRYLANDLCVKHSIPWIYGACVGTEGRVMPILPGKTACLRCIFPDPPAPHELPSCDTAGVLGPAAAMVGSMQAAIAIKMLSGNETAIPREMFSFDLWTNRFHAVSTRDARRADCPACGQRRYDFLDAMPAYRTARLCGRDAVQISPGHVQDGDLLDRAASRLAAVGRIRRNEHLLRASLPDGVELTLFPDGRAIVHGVRDPARARSVYARFIGA
jgi:adenylyltransferase/sulfurtransferase